MKKLRYVFDVLYSPNDGAWQANYIALALNRIGHVVRGLQWTVIVEISELSIYLP